MERMDVTNSLRYFVNYFNPNVFLVVERVEDDLKVAPDRTARALRCLRRPALLRMDGSV